MDRQGRLIVFEGIDGTGKSTHIAHLAEWVAQFVPVVTTREPAGTDLGLAIKPILDAGGLPPLVDFFFQEALRADHIHRVVKPALSEGKTVLCDRFEESTNAYQRYAKKVPGDLVDIANIHSSGGLKADLTIILLLPVEEALKRICSRGQITSYETLGMLEKAAQYYEGLSALKRPDMVSLDARLSEETLRDRIREAVAERFGIPLSPPPTLRSYCGR